ncbi:MAG TPA: ABC transporter permease [Chitinivibrionales bacterium]|nr:ABC transporter permease [Chitinivibrionales bacterium]
MRKLLHIVKYTVVDLLHQKSFFILLGVSIAFVLLLRGCYKGNYVDASSGHAIDSVKVAWYASIFAFHVVCAGVLLIAVILSMGLFSRDRENGTTLYMLSAPVSRTVYAAGRVVGVWIVSFGFMFVLHLTIFIITFLNAGGTMPGYLAASLVCSVNVLFVTLLVCLLSLFMPDFAAAIVGIGIVGISYVSDLFYVIMQSSVVQSAVGTAAGKVSVWRMAWPKISSLQSYAISLVDNSPFHSIGPVHPLINMTLYSCLISFFLVLAFRKREL